MTITEIQLQNIKKMMHRRGFTEFVEDHPEVPEVKKYSKVIVIKVYRRPETGKIIVIFIIDGEFRKVPLPISEVITTLAESPQESEILILCEKNVGTKTIPMNAQIMVLKRFYFDLIESRAVPSHRVITDPTEYQSIKKDKMPIMPSDALSEYYNWPTGTVVYVNNREIYCVDRSMVSDK